MAGGSSELDGAVLRLPSGGELPAGLERVHLLSMSPGEPAKMAGLAEAGARNLDAAEAASRTDAGGLGGSRRGFRASICQDRGSSCRRQRGSARLSEELPSMLPCRTEGYPESPRLRL